MGREGRDVSGTLLGPCAHSLGEGPERNHYPISQVRQLRLMEMDELAQGVGVPVRQSRIQTQVYVTSRGPSSECQGDRRDSFLHPLNKYMLHRYDVPGTARHRAVNKGPQLVSSLVKERWNTFRP